MKALVRLTDVTRHYRLSAETIKAVDGVSLELTAEAVVGLVGPSGAGKTTLINLIVGWEEPTAGTIERSVGGDWEGLAVVPQGLGLIPELTLAENIGLPARLGNPQSRTTGDLAAALGLEELEDRLPSEVSLGEQQRAAIARALAPDPHVLIVDEPTSHQDEANVRRIALLLAECATRGAGVLVATHDERILSSIDRVVRIEDGRIV